jgi:holo-[acyl-carrier protein] synthase
MNVLSHGVDFVEIHRVAALVERHGATFLDRVYTPGEQAYCREKKRQIEHLAGRFAAKEAVLKVMGTGWRSGIAWTDVEVVNAPSGQPSIRLAGRCAEIAAQQGIRQVLISISHTDTHAMASAIGLGK